MAKSAQLLGGIMSDIKFRITFLGTGAPPPTMRRFGPSTLVEAGKEKLIFDAGRGAMQRLNQLGIPFGDITGIFLTHHHSDHLVGFTDLWLTGWIGRVWGHRKVPLKVWGPEGTNQMVKYLPLAFATDIEVRSHSYPVEGVKLESLEINEGFVFENNGLKVSPFLVDHGGEKLIALGYRIEYEGRSVVLSGDTRFNENVIKYGENSDVLIHEVVHGMMDGMERANLERITNNHTLPEQAGIVFSRSRPRLAVFTHILLLGKTTSDEIIPATRKTYNGPLVVAEDLTQIEVGEEIKVSQFEA